ncbi:hypothetical protein Agub_g6334, partial [Astrephomene gubernaculifera]
MAGYEFSSCQAALRIRRVQAFCKQQALDAVLLVPGVDGRFSVCNQAIAYLLEGRSNRDTIDVNKLDGQLDECSALITPDEVAFYVASPDLQQHLQDLLTPHVTNLRLLGPTASEAADMDMLEENKLASFVHLLRGCRRIGIPCGLAATTDSSSPSAADFGAVPRLPPLTAAQQVELERWPLLQAYGLEGVGRSGFFTMNFEVCDVLPGLQRQLYGRLDGRALAVVAGEAAGALRLHWEAMMQTLCGKAAGGRGSLAERQLAEPLSSYMAYGLLREVAGVEQAVMLPPRVIFGPRTSDDTATSGAATLMQCGYPLQQQQQQEEGSAAASAAAAAASAAAPTVSSSSSSSWELPLHFVAEAADPRSPLRVARTYFLSRGAVERDVFADPDEEAAEGFDFPDAAARCSARNPDLLLLLRGYSALVEAGRAAMRHFAEVEGATALSAKAEAQRVLTRRAEQLGLLGEAKDMAAGGEAGAGAAAAAAALASRLRFSLYQCDHANVVTAPAVRGSRQLKVLRLSLSGLVSRSGPLAGRELGGLVYGDTFIDIPQPPAPAPVPGTGAGAVGAGGGADGSGNGGGSSSSSGGSLLVLTEGVPLLAAVPAGGSEEELAARALRSLGRVVGGRAGARAARVASAASQRDQQRRAGAAAAAESQALAAKLRARRLGAAAVAEEEEEEEGEEEEADVEEDDEDEDEGAPAGRSAPRQPGAAAAAAAATAVPQQQQPADALGALLTLGGGEEAVLLTGAPACPALSGWLHCFSGGGVFVERASRATWVLLLAPRQQAGAAGGAGGGAVEAITVQQLPLPGAAVTGGGSGGGGGGLGEAVVFRGVAPACGLPPACHLTANTHLALPLAAMSPAARRLLMGSVLPAWQQTCRQAALAAAEAHDTPSAASYRKDMTAPNPFPSMELYAAHAYAIQSSTAGGSTKSWPALAAEDSLLEAALERLDAQELHGPLSGLDPAVEALLQLPLTPPPPTPPAPQPAPSPPYRTSTTITLIVGLPGADQAAVAAALSTMLEGGGGGEQGPAGAAAGGAGRAGGARVAMLPCAATPLSEADFTAALSAAAAAAMEPESGGAGGAAAGGTVQQQQQRHLIMCTASYLGLHAQLRMLAAAVGKAAAAAAAHAWRVGSVVVCCSADVAWEEPARGALAAGLLGQLAAGGLVDCVVVGGSEADKVSWLAQLLSRRLPGVPQLRASRPHLLRARSELLPDPRERAARLGARQAVAGRHWGPLRLEAEEEDGGLSGGGSGGGGGGGLLGPLHATRVAFQGPLDFGKLRSELAALGVPQSPASLPPLPLADPEASPAAARPGLVCVSGCVRLTRGSRPCELLGSRQTELRSREWWLAAGAGEVVLG